MDSSKLHKLHATDLRLTKTSVAGTGVRTSTARRPGDFLGFYSGEIVSVDAYRQRASNDATVERVSFEITGTDAIVVRTSPEDIIGYINEPPPGKTSNVVAIPLHLDLGNAVGYFAATHIRSNDELLVHYGSKATRDYPVGRRARAPRRLQRADAVISRDAMRCTFRYCAPRAP